MHIKNASRSFALSKRKVAGHSKGDYPHHDYNSRFKNYVILLSLRPNLFLSTFFLSYFVLDEKILCSIPFAKRKRNARTLQDSSK